MPFRWAIIGPGGIAPKFADALAGVEGAELHTAVSRSRDRAQAFIDRHGGAMAYDRVEDMLSDDRVDGVYIATPHRFHHDDALACLEAGKAVLCEKPLVISAAQAKSLIDASQRTGTFLMEAMWSRFLPIYEQVHRWLDAREIGPARLVYSTFGMPLYGRVPDDHRIVDPEQAGGVAFDMGIYPIAVTQHIFGADPQRVQAIGQVNDNGVDLFAGVTLDYGKDRFAQFSCTLLSDTKKEMVIHGPDGRIEIEPAFFGSTRATLVLHNDCRTITTPHRVNGFEYQIEEAVKCASDGLIESPRMPHAQTLANAQVIDDIREQIGARYAFE